MQSDGDMDNVVIQRKKGGTITGFEVNDDAIKHLRFNKINYQLKKRA